MFRAVASRKFTSFPSSLSPLPLLQHEAVYGRSGPPRLAFKNPTITSPVDEFGRRVSFGCLQGPFTTGVLANGSEFSFYPQLPHFQKGLGSRVYQKRRTDIPLLFFLSPSTADTGADFSLAEIEANPPAFFADTHTAAYAAGAIRGQLELKGTTYSKY